MQTIDRETLEQPGPKERPGSRWWMAVLGAVILGALAFGLGVVVGSGGDGGEVDAVPAPEVVTAWGGAFVAGDSEALAALYAQGGAFNCRAFDFTIDRGLIADVVMGDETDFKEFRPTTVLVGDEIIAVEYLVSAESPSGKSISTPMIAVFDVDASGLIRQSIIDYDRGEMFPDDFATSSEQGLAPLGCPAGG